jgi:hypothetical protein
MLAALGLAGTLGAPTTPPGGVAGNGTIVVPVQNSAIQLLVPWLSPDSGIPGIPAIPDLDFATQQYTYNNQHLFRWFNGTNDGGWPMALSTGAHLDFTPQLINPSYGVPGGVLWPGIRVSNAFAPNGQDWDAGFSLNSDCIGPWCWGLAIGNDNYADSAIPYLALAIYSGRTPDAEQWGPLVGSSLTAYITGSGDFCSETTGALRCFSDAGGAAAGGGYPWIQTSATNVQPSDAGFIGITVSGVSNFTNTLNVSGDLAVTANTSIEATTVSIDGGNVYLATGEGLYVGSIDGGPNGQLFTGWIYVDAGTFYTLTTPTIQGTGTYGTTTFPVNGVTSPLVIGTDPSVPTIGGYTLLWFLASDGGAGFIPASGSNYTFGGNGISSIFNFPGTGGEFLIQGQGASIFECTATYCDSLQELYAAVGLTVQAGGISDTGNVSIASGNLTIGSGINQLTFNNGFSRTGIGSPPNGLGVDDAGSMWLNSDGGSLFISISEQNSNTNQIQLEAGDSLISAGVNAANGIELEAGATAITITDGGTSFTGPVIGPIAMGHTDGGNGYVAQVSGWDGGQPNAATTPRWEINFFNLASSVNPQTVTTNFNAAFTTSVACSCSFITSCGTVAYFTECSGAARSSVTATEGPSCSGGALASSMCVGF